MYLYCRGKRTAGVNEKGRHGSNNIVTETLHGAKRKRAPYRDARHEKKRRIYLVAAAAMSMLVSLRVSPSTVPLTVT